MPSCFGFFSRTLRAVSSTLEGAGISYIVKELAAPALSRTFLAGAATSVGLPATGAVIGATISLAIWKCCCLKKTEPGWGTLGGGLTAVALEIADHYKHFLPGGSLFHDAGRAAIHAGATVFWAEVAEEAKNKGGQQFTDEELGHSAQEKAELQQRRPYQRMQ